MKDPIYQRILGYSVAIAVHTANIIDMENHVQVASKDPVMKEFCTLQLTFITTWTFAFQLGYSVFGLCCDTLHLTNKKHELVKKARQLREILCSAVMWPSTLLVFSLFWTLALYDINLVFPTFIDHILSPANNHVIHTFILPVTLWETAFLPKRKPSHKINLALLTVFISSYLVVMFSTYAIRGYFMYPILTMTYGTMYFNFFVCLVLVLVYFMYYLQWRVTKYIKCY